jgi:DNA-binding winged-HTH domains
MPRAVREIYEFGDFRLDVAEHLLLRRTERQPLPQKAFQILSLLVENAGHLVCKDELFRTVWGGTFVEVNNLDKNISLLRRALGEKKGERKFIETVRGRGYRFVAPVVRLLESGEIVSEERREISPPAELEKTNHESEKTNPKNAFFESAIPSELRRDVLKNKGAVSETENAEPPVESQSARKFTGARKRKIKSAIYFLLAAAIVLFVIAGGYFFDKTFRRQNSEILSPK